MTFVPILQRGGGASVAINTATVIAIEDNGDGTGSIVLNGRAPFPSALSAAAIVAALGVATINITRSGNTRATVFNPAQVVAFEPSNNPATGAAGCRMRLPDASTFTTETALATIVAMLDPATIITAARTRETIAAAITRAQVANVRPNADVYTGVAGAALLLRDGHDFHTDAPFATIVAALNA